MLPSTRNTNCDGSSSLASADLNDIQDCIVGNKHPELEVDIFAWDFVADGLDKTTLHQDGYVTHSAAGIASTLRAAVKIPVGKRITTVEVFYDGAGDAATMLPKLRRRTFATGAQVDVVAGVPDTSNGITSQVLVANHVVLADDAYFIEVAVASGAHRVNGATVKFDAL